MDNECKIYFMLDICNSSQDLWVNFDIVRGGWQKSVFRNQKKNVDTLTDGFVNLNLKVPDAAITLKETVNL